MEILRKSNSNILLKKTSIPSTLTTGFFTKILRNSADRISSNVFTLAYATDHLNQYETEIKPLKESSENYVVIQERCMLSTILYQSSIGKTDIGWLREINKFNKNMPNLTLVLKVNLEEILKRSLLEKMDFDKFEGEKHLKDEVQAYNSLSPELLEEFEVKYVDANREPEKIAKDCSEIIQMELEKFFK